MRTDQKSFVLGGLKCYGNHESVLQASPITRKSGFPTTHFTVDLEEKVQRAEPLWSTVTMDTGFLTESRGEA